MKISKTQKIIRYAVAICEEYRDQHDEINLTGLNEEVMAHFGIDGQEYDDQDYNFEVYMELERQRLL